MTKPRIAMLAAAAVVAGLAAAFALAPHVRLGNPDAGAMRPMWAHHYGSLAGMARDSDAVVLATVETTRPGRVVATPGGDLPFTLADLRVEKVVRGRSDDLIAVEQTGGEVDDRALYVDGDGGRYVPGERVLLFLKRQPETEYYYLVHPQGRFSEERGRLRAAAPDDPVAQQLDGRTAREALGILRALR